MAPDNINCVSGRSHLTSDLCHLTSDLCHLTSDLCHLTSVICLLTSVFYHLFQEETQCVILVPFQSYGLQF